MPPSSKLSAAAIVDTTEQVWLPYDLPFLPTQTGFRPISAGKGILNANYTPFRLDYANVKTLHIINGMGVALGDSVVGLSVLHWLKTQYPQLAIVLYRSPHAPAHVEEIYRLAPWAQVRLLPVPLAELTAADGVVIDLADFMFRPAFDALPMVDFFLDSLGMEPGTMPAAAKANSWLAHIPRPPLPNDLPLRYTLLCPRASSPLRTMPVEITALLATHLLASGQTVLGFGQLGITGYRDVGAVSSGLPQLLALIAGAERVISVDSAIVHLAAGLGVPCTALFMGIQPGLRVRDYPHCEAIQLDQTGQLSGLHHADAGWQIDHARQCWQSWQSWVTTAMPTR
ncbi:glycosyltransferase family 9 protein [Andreprevotia chitinilytica]|uniref:glycosyltransferase family 9 protein n=1 Tax=Andreprevotia chitinilytica TaxID=396808 RepID=UPI00068D2352|nr:glycosyltransferase family 9 protein [Andreprevotia chitinilytica]